MLFARFWFLRWVSQVIRYDRSNTKPLEFDSIGLFLVDVKEERFLGEILGVEQRRQRPGRPWRESESRRAWPTSDQTFSGVRAGSKVGVPRVTS
jgi:hypothetical protein